MDAGKTSAGSGGELQGRKQNKHRECVFRFEQRPGLILADPRKTTICFKSIFKHLLVILKFPGSRYRYITIGIQLNLTKLYKIRQNPQP